MENVNVFIEAIQLLSSKLEGNEDVQPLLKKLTDAYVQQEKRAEEYENKYFKCSIKFYAQQKENFVQAKIIKELLAEKYKITDNDVSTLPF